MNTQTQETIQGINHHVQSIELLSNELIYAYQENNIDKQKHLQEQLNKENQALQKQKQELIELLKITQDPSR